MGENADGRGNTRGRRCLVGQKPIDLPMISFMISFVPP